MKTKQSSVPNPSRRPRVSASPRLSSLSPLRSSPKYGIRKHTSYWAVDFDGQTAVFDHEQGAYYVAYLLLNPPSEPIHGMALALRAQALYHAIDGETYIVDPFTSKVVPLPSDAMVLQRNLCLDDAEALAGLRRKQLKLEAILQEENESEPTKAEVLRELEAIYEFQKHNSSAALSTVQKVVRAVRRAIQRFHHNLANAAKPNGNPHPVLRSFAAHVEKYLIIPSARHSRPGQPMARDEITGRFTYEPPRGVSWSQ